MRISEALDELADRRRAAARIVDLKFFCGFSFAEIAAMMGCLGADGAARLGEGAHLPAPRAAQRLRGE